MRDAFFSELAELFVRDDRAVFVTGDLGYKLFDSLVQIDRKRVVNFGIREPSMIGYAAGLGKTGLLPFVYSIVPFLTLRCLEQIKLDLCYNRCSVVLVGVGGGLAYGPNGPSHHGPDDVGTLSCLPGLRILTPGDPHEVRTCIKAIPDLKGPTYLRLGRNKEPELSAQVVHPLEIVRPRILTQGDEGTIVSFGSVGSNVLRAGKILRDQGIKPRIVHLMTFRPFPEEQLLRLLKDGAPVVTVEEHVASGGLGHRMAAMIATNGCSNPFRMLAIPDRFPDVCLDHDAALKWAGLDPKSIAREFLALFNRSAASARMGGIDQIWQPPVSYKYSALSAKT